MARCVAALNERGNTLGVAPTGSGKTVMFSAVAARLPGRKLILQHRDELVAQNAHTFRALNPGAQVGLIDAERKQLGSDNAFAMVQTLSRKKNLERLGAFDTAIIDEAHHSAAPSYKQIINRLRELNPNVLLFGVSATPNRGDKKNLVDVFDNVADQITLEELVRTGALVRPRCFVIDIGVQEDLRQVRQSISDFDMSEVAAIMDRKVLHDQIVAHWKEKAGDRQTVVFCSTVQHADHVLGAFQSAGVSAALVTGETPEAQRKALLRRFDQSAFQVLVNVAVLTEGWDCQPVSCVVLLRPCSYKSTMIQMIGRGLRRLDPEKYPGRVKTDCIVLDFGTSLLTHGSLEQRTDLEPENTKGAAPTKECPSCKAVVPLNAAECAICGHVFEAEPEEEDVEAGVGGEKDALSDFAMTEIDIFNASPYRWEELWDGAVLVATAFDAWAMTVWFEGNWHALGGSKGLGIKHLSIGERLICLASADDFLREWGDSSGAAKQKRWLHMPATEKQLEYLGLPGGGAAMTRYQAACHLTWRWNERHVHNRLTQTTRRVA